MRTATIITICTAVYVFLVTNVFLKKAAEDPSHSGGFYEHKGISICPFGVWMGVIVTLLLAIQSCLIEANWGDNAIHSLIMTGVIGLISFWLLLLAHMMNTGVFLLMIPAGIAQVVTFTQLNWN